MNIEKMNFTIPDRIVQTGRDANHPLLIRAAISTVKLLNPDHEYLFFDDAQVERFVREEFPKYVGVFEAFKYKIQRFDFFRYLAVYRYGGFYFDLDVILGQSVAALSPRGCVFPFEGLTFSRLLRDEFGMDWHIGNYAFGAAPGHPFLEAVIDNCVRGVKDPKWVLPMMRGCPLRRDEFFVLNATGPGLISRTLAENKELAKTVTVLFPEDVCDVRKWNNFGEFGVHLATSSWRPQRSFIANRITGYWARWIEYRRIEESRRWGGRRSHGEIVAHDPLSLTHNQGTKWKADRAFTKISRHGGLR